MLNSNVAAKRVGTDTSQGAASQILVKTQQTGVETGLTLVSTELSC